MKLASPLINTPQLLTWTMSLLIGTKTSVYCPPLERQGNTGKTTYPSTSRRWSGDLKKSLFFKKKKQHVVVTSEKILISSHGSIFQTVAFMKLTLKLTLPASFQAPVGQDSLSEQIQNETISHTNLQPDR